MPRVTVVGRVDHLDDIRRVSGLIDGCGRVDRQMWTILATPSSTMAKNVLEWRRTSAKLSKSIVQVHLDTFKVSNSS